MSIDLKPTQIVVLKVLYKQDKHMGVNDIKRYCDVSTANIANAIRFFLNHDFVYQPDIQGKVLISPDGKDAISRYL